MRASRRQFLKVPLTLAGLAAWGLNTCALAMMIIGLAVVLSAWEPMQNLEYWRVAYGIAHGSGVSEPCWEWQVISFITA